MSTAVGSTSAAPGRLFFFEDEAVAEACPPVSGNHRRPEEEEARLDQAEINHPPSKIPPAGVVSASRLEIRPAPEKVSTGIPALDTLAGGLPRGCLTEICGPASSGRTTLLLAALAAATCRGEFCAVVDASDALDPNAAAAAGVDLDRMLWVRCAENSPQKPKDAGKKNFPCDRISKSETVEFRSAEQRLEQLLRAADLLLESGGFGLIALDLSDLPLPAARRIPLATWFRFRRAVEYKPTILLVLEPQPIAGSCSSLLIRLGAQGSRERVVQEDDGFFVAVDSELAAKRRKNAAHGVSRGCEGKDCEAPEGRKEISCEQSFASQFPAPTHAQLLAGLEITAELVRSRLERKPARSAEITFASQTAWAG